MKPDDYVFVTMSYIVLLSVAGILSFWLGYGIAEMLDKIKKR